MTQDPQQAGLQQALGAPPEDYQAKINRQKQTPYAAQNGMNTGGAASATGARTGAAGSMGGSGIAAGTAAAATTRASGLSPVTANGKINEANAPAPPPPVAAPYQQGRASAGNQTMVQPGQAPMLTEGANYAPGTVSQYGGGTDMNAEAQLQTALTAALQGGGGLPVEQLKARLKDDALAMRDDNIQAMRGSAAGAGRIGSGFMGNLEGSIRAGALEQVLGSNREIDIADATARNENQYRGIALGNELLSGRQGRASSDYQTALGGQLAQEDLGFKGAANNRDNFLAQLEAHLGGRQIDQQGNIAQIGAASNDYGARLRLLGDLAGIMENARSNDQQTGLGWGGIQASLLGRL